MNGLDLYRDLKRKIKKEHSAQCVSNAWLKMYELCAHYRLLWPTPVRRSRPHPPQLRGLEARHERAWV